MKQFFDRIAVSFISLIFLTMLEGGATLGLAFHFEKYTPFVWGVQVMVVLLAVWVGQKIYDGKGQG